MTHLSLRRLRGLNGFSALALFAALATTGCTAVGPSRGAVDKAPVESALRGIQIIDLDDVVARRLKDVATPGFAETLGNAMPIGSVVQAGDVLGISIWEAPPAALFGNSSMQSAMMASMGGNTSTSTSTSLPEFLVQPTGTISVPFAGVIPVAGKTLPQIERAIVGRLQGKAHLPQVIVRMITNQSATATIVGEVNRSAILPLTPKGERLLDALAVTGGTRQPVEKMTIQVSRDGRTYSMPLQAVIADPRQNIVLKTNDVVTALYQPYSFTMLGAAGKNEEVKFEATGLTLAQALGRVSGLQDGRADAKGVFIFRWEQPAAVPVRDPGVGRGPDGRIPTIYRINMKDPAVYFAMQNFQMRDQDVVYISNSPVMEFQRVFGLIAQSIFPIIAIDNAVSNN